jgi:hypothetical protein
MWIYIKGRSIVLKQKSAPHTKFNARAIQTRTIFPQTLFQLLTSPLPSNALIGLNIKPPTYYLDPCKE